MCYHTIGIVFVVLLYPEAEPAASASEPPTKRQRNELETGSDGRATGGDRAGSGRPPPRLQTKPYDDLRGHTGFLLFCTKHVGDGAAEA